MFARVAQQQLNQSAVTNYREMEGNADPNRNHPEAKECQPDAVREAVSKATKAIAALHGRGYTSASITRARYIDIAVAELCLVKPVTTVLRARARVAASQNVDNWSSDDMANVCKKLRPALGLSMRCCPIENGGIAWEYTRGMYTCSSCPMPTLVGVVTYGRHAEYIRYNHVDRNLCLDATFGGGYELFRKASAIDGDKYIMWECDSQCRDRFGCLGDRRDEATSIGPTDRVFMIHEDGTEVPLDYALAFYARCAPTDGSYAAKYRARDCPNCGPLRSN